jgi:hypothetical protein
MCLCSAVCCSDKNSKRIRDMHLLKQLKLLLKEQTVENGIFALSVDSVYNIFNYVACLQAPSFITDSQAGLLLNSYLK